jgi:AcrR family transcriptional regulator
MVLDRRDNVGFMTAADVRTESRASRRDRLLDAAAMIVIAEGWSNVTMSRLAAAVDVSRQSVYNELGGKDKLAVALVLRENERFLSVVQLRLLENQRNMTAAITVAVEAALLQGQDNPLLKAVIAPGQAKADILLPLLATQPEPVLEAAVTMLTAFAEEHWTGCVSPQQDLLDLMDAVVRLTLSHLMQPNWPIARVTAMVGRMVDAAQAASGH